MLGKIEFKILYHLIENDFLSPAPKVNIQQLQKGRAYIKGINKNQRKLQSFIQNLKKKGMIKEYTVNDKIYYTYTLKGINEFYKRDINEEDYKIVTHKIISYIIKNSIPVNLYILNSYLGETYHSGIESFHCISTPKELYEIDFLGYQEMVKEVKKIDTKSIN